jgi:hypothetical protein
MDGSATSKPEPFLHKPQKRFSTPRISIVHGITPVPRRRVRHPPAVYPAAINGDKNASYHYHRSETREDNPLAAAYAPVEAHDCA